MARDAFEAHATLKGEYEAGFTFRAFVVLGYGAKEAERQRHRGWLRRRRANIVDCLDAYF